jgi:hypothetical protein
MIQTQPVQRLQPNSPTQELQQQQTTGIRIDLKANDERPRLPQAAPSQPYPVTACRFTRAGLGSYPARPDWGETGQGMMVFEAQHNGPSAGADAGETETNEAIRSAPRTGGHPGRGAKMEEK